MRYSDRKNNTHISFYKEYAGICCREAYSKPSLISKILDVRKSRVPSGRIAEKCNKSRRGVCRNRVLGLMTLCFLAVCFLTVGVLHSSADSEKEHKFKYYTSVVIEEGDTLWSIADQYMDKEIQGKVVYIDEVKSINHIHDGNRIIAGQMIIVPYYSTEYIAD